jgi:Glycosyltransferase family 87
MMKYVPSYVLTLFLALPPSLIGFEIPAWYGVFHQTLAFTSDLRVFYTPGYMLRTGQRSEIYDFSAIRRNQSKVIARDDNAVPFLHPAYEGLIFIPLSLLPYRTAYLAWAVFNLIVLTIIFVLLRPFLKEISSVAPAWVVPGLLLGFMPIAFTIIEGQDSLLLLLVLVMVHRRVNSDEMGAGVLLSLGMFRFQILLPIVALFLFWRRLRFVIGWLAGSIALLGLSAGITGIQAQLQYIRVLQAMSKVSLWELIRRMPNMRALFAVIGVGAVPLAIASAAVFSLALATGFRQNTRQKLLLAICVSVLVPYYLFFHDLSILALPILLALNQSITRGDWVHAILTSTALSGYAVFWFTSGKLYLAAIFSLFFLITEISFLCRQRTSALEG